MSEMKKFERIRRLETVKKYEPYQLAGLLDDLIDELQQEKAAAEKKGWEDTHVTVETWGEDTEISICAWRWETDAEFNKRFEDWKHHLEKGKKRKQQALERAKRKLEKTEEEERQMYEQLKRKFG